MYRKALRLGSARVVVSGRPLVLLDEPTVHLDAATAQATLAALDRATTGRSVLLAGHDEIGKAWCDRAVDLAGTCLGAPNYAVS